MDFVEEAVKSVCKGLGHTHSPEVHCSLAARDTHAVVRLAIAPLVARLEALESKISSGLNPDT